MATSRGSIPVTVCTVEALGDTIGGAGEPRTENIYVTHTVYPSITGACIQGHKYVLNDHCVKIYIDR